MHYFGVELVPALCTARKNIKLINAQTKLHKELIKSVLDSHTPTKVVCSHCNLVLLKGNPFRDGQKSYMPKRNYTILLRFLLVVRREIKYSVFCTY